MTELKAKQRDSLDDQIRLKCANERGIAQMLGLSKPHSLKDNGHMEVSQALCPFDPACFSKNTSICNQQDYRGCIVYKSDLAVYVIGGRVHLDTNNFSKI